MSSDRRSYDIGVSQQVQGDLNAIIGQLESLIEQRDSQVKAAMADFQADGVSDQYADKERRWQRAADEVRGIIGLIKTTLEKNDATAQTALQRANTAVSNIG
jgi:Skp family chaperone for outer membrane proteins